MTKAKAATEVGRAIERDWAFGLRLVRVACLVAATLLLVQLGTPAVAWADSAYSADSADSANSVNSNVATETSRERPYKPQEAGHPLRIAGYLLHPVGVILDTLIVRPAYWLGTREPIKTLVGNTD